MCAVSEESVVCIAALVIAAAVAFVTFIDASIGPIRDLPTPAVKYEATAVMIIRETIPSDLWLSQ